jgi:ubiquinone/menaquinone biosynthesis C-methylase UbiE
MQVAEDMRQEKDFASLTESIGADFSELQMQMAWFRYTFANERIRSGRVLEVGAGTGFGRPAFDSKEYVAAEFDSVNLGKLREQNDGTMAVQASGELLPFAGGSFAGVVALEMLYYLENQESFVSEAFRVLSPGGSLIVCLANSARSGFHRSPYSTSYPNADALRILLESGGFSVEIFGGFLDRKIKYSNCWPVSQRVCDSFRIRSKVVQNLSAFSKGRWQNLEDSRCSPKRPRFGPDWKNSRIPRAPQTLEFYIRWQQNQLR